jgi:hypothetical protein
MFAIIIPIFALLSRVEYQLPNLIVSAITKESIYGAFENGITAEQVILIILLRFCFTFSSNMHTVKYSHI